MFSFLRFLQQSAKNCSCKNLFHCRYFDGRYRTERDSEDEEDYHLEDENTVDNPVDNASSSNVVIVNASLEQSVTIEVDVIVIE